MARDKDTVEYYLEGSIDMNLTVEQIEWIPIRRSGTQFYDGIRSGRSAVSSIQKSRCFAGSSMATTSSIKNLKTSNGVKYTRADFWEQAQLLGDMGKKDAV